MSGVYDEEQFPSNLILHTYPRKGEQGLVFRGGQTQTIFIGMCIYPCKEFKIHSV